MNWGGFFRFLRIGQHDEVEQHEVGRQVGVVTPGTGLHVPHTPLVYMKDTRCAACGSLQFYPTARGLSCARCGTAL